MESTGEAIVATPPRFLPLAGHPLRWRLLSELARSDRRVRELIGLVGRPQSLVSYHLGRLRAGGLVSVRRSSADGRDAYYTVDLVRCGELLSAAGGALHPALRLTPPEAPGLGRRRRTTPVRVLFLCTGNSSRSQIAEALLRHLGGGAAEAESAGSHPKPVHPETIRVLRERGIDARGRRSKHLDEFAGRRFDDVVTLCDRVREVCPEFPEAPNWIHWSLADPALEGSTDEERAAAFERAADEIETRVRFLLHRIDQRPTGR
jgi:protein-tyrosine-phosphatase